MGKWRKIKVGYSDGSGVVTDDAGAYLTTDDKNEDTVVTGGCDDWSCGVGVLQGDEAERLASCWNALTWSENPKEDVDKLFEMLRRVKYFAGHDTHIDADSKAILKAIADKGLTLKSEVKQNE